MKSVGAHFVRAAVRRRVGRCLALVLHEGQRQLLLHVQRPAAPAQPSSESSGRPQAGWYAPGGRSGAQAAEVAARAAGAGRQGDGAPPRPLTGVPSDWCSGAVHGSLASQIPACWPRATCRRRGGGHATSQSPRPGRRRRAPPGPPSSPLPAAQLVPARCQRPRSLPHSRRAAGRWRRRRAAACRWILGRPAAATRRAGAAQVGGCASCQHRGHRPHYSRIQAPRSARRKR